MKLGSWMLIICLLIVCVVSIPSASTPAVNNQPHEVQGAVVEENIFEKAIRKLLPIKNSHHETITEKESTSDGVVASIQEKVLLSEELAIENQTHVFVISDDWSTTHPERTFVSIVFKMISEEDGVGFDDPALVISINDDSTYQLSRNEFSCSSVIESQCETEWLTRTFVADLHQSPKSISIWSGNSGDEEKPTSAIVKELRIFKQTPNTEYSVHTLGNFTITKDTEQFSTVAWVSPVADDTALGKPLRYELKHANTPNPSLSDWLTLPNVRIVLPTSHALVPRAPHTPEELLIENNADYVYILIRVLDWQGNAREISVAST